MKTIKKIWNQPNMECGYLYFYIHFITEIICFYSLSKIVGDSVILWISPFLYDTFAFVPQSIIGYLKDIYPKIKVGFIGIILLTMGAFFLHFKYLPGSYTALIMLSLGNACIHISGAETTLRLSQGKLSHSAIFVSGGSFGVITGTLLAKTNITIWSILILSLTMIPFYLLAEQEQKESKENTCSNFNYHNSKRNKKVIILLTMLIIIVRGYMAYGIPTSWNKTILQSIMLYFTMGIGKALGGILSDIYGANKIAKISILLSLPFLLFGDHLMCISLFGILLFSMTMSITLVLLVSILKETPGLAFGLTTISLFLGTLPIFFIRINSFFINVSLIIVINTICFIIVKYIMKGEKNEKNHINY